MESVDLVLDLALAWGAAFVGGLLAQRLRQPLILGYLVAGAVLSPFTPGPVIHGHTIDVLAEIGVTFLMFALGTEFSLREMGALGRAVVLGGPLQIVLSMGIGVALADPLHLSLGGGVFLGGVIALSSTVVALKVLMGRGEMQRLHGRLALGILITQDLAVVPLVVLLPTLTTGGDSAHLVVDVALIAAKAAAVVVGVYLIGARIVPWLLRHAAFARSRELFLLGIVGLALGTGLLTRQIGLSLAFGAFLAGLVVAESEFRTQVLAEVLPLRDLFTSLFFVSVGLLIDPAPVFSHLGLVALLAGGAIFGKAIIASVVEVVLGIPLRLALLAAVSIAQIGEFSFVLARIGVTSGAIPRSVFDLILAAAVVSIILSPSLLAATSGAVQRLENLPWIGERLRERVDPAPETETLQDHTVIAGYGRVGREVARALRDEGLPYLIVEYNPALVESLRSDGEPTTYGDVSNPVVLEHAGLDRARVFTVLVPDPLAAERATEHARHLNPSLDIQVRVTDARQAERLRAVGATDVVQPEFEAGVAVVGHVLRRYGRPGPELARTIIDRRADFYRRGSRRSR